MPGLLLPWPPKVKGAMAYVCYVSGTIHCSRTIRCIRGDSIMGITDKLKDLIGKKGEPKKTNKKKQVSEKELATKNKEPYINILSMDVDPENLNEGAFELDWNDIFIARLIKAGYQGKEDQDLVDQWFQNVCRNVVLETYQQEQAMNPGMKTNKRDLGDGKSEIS